MSILKYIECDISKDRTWSGQYHCGIHSVWFRDDSEDVLHCPCYDLASSIEKDVVDIDVFQEMRNHCDEMDGLLTQIRKRGG